MPRTPSPETENRRLRSDVRRLTREREELARQCNALRGQLTKAQQESADWRRRFDMLLARETVLAEGKVQP